MTGGAATTAARRRDRVPAPRAMAKRTPFGRHSAASAPRPAAAPSRRFSTARAAHVERARNTASGYGLEKTRALGNRAQIHTAQQAAVTDPWRRARWNTPTKPKKSATWLITTDVTASGSPAAPAARITPGISGKNANA